MSQPPRRPKTATDARSAAEAAFKAVTAPRVEAPVKKAAVPGVKEQVTLRIDQDVLEYFQGRRARLAGQDQRRVAQGCRKIRLLFRSAHCRSGDRGHRSLPNRSMQLSPCWRCGEP